MNHRDTENTEITEEESTEGSEEESSRLLTREIIGAAIEVHRELGPGLLESVYKRALAFELTCRGLSLECEKPVH